MGRDHRPHAQVRHEGSQLLGRDPLRGGSAHDLGERAPQLGAALHLGLAAQPHRRVLLGDGEQLEPRALRLDGARDQLGGRPVPRGLASQHGLELRLMDADHLDELIEQQLRHLVEIRGRSTGGGGGGVVAHTTRSRGAIPAKNAVRLSNARMPMATRVSCVALPRCGSSTTFSMVKSAGVT